MIMRFRPANISLINRRHYLPRLLLILSSKRQMQKPPQRFEDVDRVTPYQGRVADNGIGPARPAKIHNEVKANGRELIKFERARLNQRSTRMSWVIEFRAEMVLQNLQASAGGIAGSGASTVRTISPRRNSAADSPDFRWQHKINFELHIGRNDLLGWNNIPERLSMFSVLPARQSFSPI
jgi:hypothetical protein